MKLAEALPVLKGTCGKPFKELFKGHPVDLRTNKGNVGQLLLHYIGIGLDSNLTDFSDGELKTNKANQDGSPLETMFITQISANFNSFVGPSRVSFEKSNLFKKTRNLVYLPVVKDSPSTADWYFTGCYHIQMLPGSRLYQRMREDYEAICDGLESHITSSSDGFIHTTNGPNYIQVRSKDSKPYHPIFSQHYGRYVSDKNHALYFMKSFMLDAIADKF